MPVDGVELLTGQIIFFSVPFSTGKTKQELQGSCFCHCYDRFIALHGSPLNFVRPDNIFAGGKWEILYHFKLSIDLAAIAGPDVWCNAPEGITLARQAWKWYYVEQWRQRLEIIAQATWLQFSFFYLFICLFWSFISNINFWDRLRAYFRFRSEISFFVDVRCVAFPSTWIRRHPACIADEKWRDFHLNYSVHPCPWPCPSRAPVERQLF